MPKFLFGVLIAMFLFLSKAAFAEYLSIDTFDDSLRPNNIGGDYGAWSLNWNDPSQHCEVEHERDIKKDNWGASIKIIYDVDSDNKAACGFFTLLGEGVGVRQFDRIVFYIKGDEKRGFTSKLLVEIANPHQTSRCLISGITKDWQRKEIPLTNFKEITDWSKINKFAIVIEDSIVDKKVGVIYIDDIYFSDSERAM